MHLKHWQMPLKEQEMQNNDSLLCASLCSRFLVAQVLADLVVLNSLLFYHRPSFASAWDLRPTRPGCHGCSLTPSELDSYLSQFLLSSVKELFWPNLLP